MSSIFFSEISVNSASVLGVQYFFVINPFIARPLFPSFYRFTWSINFQIIIFSAHLQVYRCPSIFCCFLQGYIYRVTFDRVTFDRVFYLYRFRPGLVSWSINKALNYFCLLKSALLIRLNCELETNLLQKIDT